MIVLIIVAMSVENSSPVCRDGDGTLNIAEPVAKRTRYASKMQLELEKMKDENSNYEPTILDFLDDYCWRTILDNVNLQDLVCSERVSQRWRSVVWRYLQGICLNLQTGSCVREENSSLSNYRTLKVPVKSYSRAIAKFGRGIVAADCRCTAELRALSKHCPKLEELMIRANRFHKLNDRLAPFNKLRRIGIYHHSFYDRDVVKFLHYTTLEELVLQDSYYVTGSCLSELKTNLKSLEIQTCYDLGIKHLAASERLSELTKLELSSNPSLSIEGLHKLVERTPKLEYLGLRTFHASYSNIELVDAICRLSMLKHLNLFNNNAVNDKWLEAFGRYCKKLETVSVGYCKDVTGVGVVALCRGAGQTLTALDACYNEHITSTAVATCISLCPKLEALNMRDCPLVNENLHTIDAAVMQSSPRLRPLRLQLAKQRSHDLDYDDSIDLDASDDSDDSDDFDFFGDSDFSDEPDEPDESETDQSESPPMEVCSDLILDYKSNIFKSGHYTLHPLFPHCFPCIIPMLE